MKANEVQDRKAVDEITLKIVEKGETREVRGGQLRVCDCVGEDETGRVNVTLWNDDTEKVKEGDTIKIKNGWAQSYQEKLSISAGRFGTLEVIE